MFKINIFKLTILLTGIMLIPACIEKKEIYHSNCTQKVYAIRHTSENDCSKMVLSQINVETGLVEQELSIKYEYGYIAILPNKNVLLGYSIKSGGGGFGQQIDQYSPQKNSIKTFAHTTYDDPAFVYGYGPYVYVIEGGDHSLELNLDIFTEKGKCLKSILLSKYSMLSSDAIFPIFNKNALSKIIMINGEYLNRVSRGKKEAFVYSYDLKGNQTYKTDYNLNNYFASITGAVYDPIHHEVYMGASLNFISDENTHLNDTNKDICIFSYPNFKFKKRIKLSEQPQKLVIDPKNNKVYVQQANSITVIDTEKKESIRTLPIRSTDLTLIGLSKLGIVINEVDFFKTPSGALSSKIGNQKLVILNTQVDQIIKEIPGDFTVLSVDLNNQNLSKEPVFDSKKRN